MNPLVLAAAQLAGVDEVYRVGGAQAVAALAYGTATIAPVAKIVGPGNAWVAAAKRRVFGQVGIDMIAGPSEVLILADAHANPDWVAADLLAQAEHDVAAQSILITDSRRPRRRRRGGGGAGARHPAAGRDRPRELARLRRHRRGARTSTRRCRSSTASRPSTSRSRREDAEALAAQDPQRGRDLPRLAHARGDRRLRRRPQPRAADGALGAVLVGARRPRLHEAHHDPALRRRARLRALGPAAIALGRSEGLEGHARSVAIRLNL